MSQKLHFTIINALTTSSCPFSGNPTPIFILNHLPSWLPVKTMQLIARELNHSDTAFLRSCDAQTSNRNKNKNKYEIRWFTPQKEEPFCGHGVLAAAIALYSLSRGTEFVFRMLSDGREVSAVVKNDESSLAVGGVKREMEVHMAFPSLPADHEVQNVNEVRGRFLRVLELQRGDIVGLKRNELGDVVVEVREGVDFSAGEMQIDALELERACPVGTRSLILTGRGKGTDGVDFEKRVFAYGCEDQATGSTYCLLAPYWGRKLGKKRMRAVQTSTRKGEADLEWDEEKPAVIVKGRGVKTVEGDVLLPSQGALAKL